jgi:hypothetical protein
MFTDVRTNVHEEERSDRPSVVNNNLVQCERRHFKLSELSCEFRQISHTLLYDIITVRLGYQKFCARWIPKMLTGAHKTKRTASAFVDFLERYHKDGDELRNHIVRVTGDETRVSFVN